MADAEEILEMTRLRALLDEAKNALARIKSRAEGPHYSDPATVEECRAFLEKLEGE